MLRLLLQAGAGLATFNLGRKIARLKRTAIFLAIAGVLGLLGLGALTAAAIIGLAPHVGVLWSPVIVAAVLILVAALLAWIATRKPKPATPPMLARMTQIGAAGAVVNAARPAPVKRGKDAPPPAEPKRSRKRVINMMLIATIAGVVLGRRL